MQWESEHEDDSRSVWDKFTDVNAGRLNTLGKLARNREITRQDDTKQDTIDGHSRWKHTSAGSKHSKNKIKTWVYKQKHDVESRMSCNDFCCFFLVSIHLLWAPVWVSCYYLHRTCCIYRCVEKSELIDVPREAVCILLSDFFYR